MNIARYAPDEDEVKAAKSRVVAMAAAVAVIRGCISSVMEGMIEAQKKLLSNGGCVRAIPVNADGEVDTATALDGQFLSTSFELQRHAEKWAETEVDWSETKEFRDIP